MSEWRTAGSWCPMDELPLNMDKCQPCRFFRGATSRPGERGYQHICCNWPRNGSELAIHPVPRVFVEGME